MIAFRKNLSLKQLIWTNTIRNNQKFLTPIQQSQANVPHVTPVDRFAANKFSKTTTATSTQTRETFTIFTYLLECIICKTQNVGNSEISFNIRLNNHRKYFKKPNGIEACKHFNNNEHTFSKHGKFIIIEQLRNINTTPTETLKLRLKERENFWIKKLKTLTPYGLNQELNWYQVMQYPQCSLYFLISAYGLNIWCT